MVIIDIAIAATAGIAGFIAGTETARAKLSVLYDHIDHLSHRHYEATTALRAMRASRSAAVSKGNRTRSANFRAKRAAKVEQLAAGK